MASGSNPRRTRQGARQVQDAYRVDPSTPQGGTPSRTRLANIPQRAIDKAVRSLRRIISKFPEEEEEDDDDDAMLGLVWFSVQGVLERDPNLKDHLANKDEFSDNVKKKGEQIFIDSLRAMAANSDEQGSKAWEDLFEDGILFSSLGFKRSDRVIRLEVFWKKIPALHVGPLLKTNKDSDKGTK